MLKAGRQASSISNLSTIAAATNTLLIDGAGEIQCTNQHQPASDFSSSRQELFETARLMFRLDSNKLQRRVTSIVQRAG